MAVDLASARAAALACANEACRNMDGNLDLEAMTRHFLAFASIAVGRPSQDQIEADAIMVLFRMLKRDGPFHTDATVEGIGRSRIDVGPVQAPSTPEERRDEVANILRPFADLADWIDRNRPSFADPSKEVQIEGWPYTLSVGWLYAARAALTPGARS